ncbi:MAG TPA: HD domain-containing protein [Candidatus Paceibacterota bacterium]
MPRAEAEAKAATERSRVIQDELTDVEKQFWDTCNTLGVSEINQKYLRNFLAPLRSKSSVTHFHYLHSLRVALLAQAIGTFLYHEEKPLLLAGALHDLGKCQSPLTILGKTDSWSDEDQTAMQEHVMDGYRMINGRFDVSAEIILWHHRFQEDGYPDKLPPFLHKYRQTTQLLIREYGRIVALADVYDALHRVDAKFGKKEGLNGKEIQEKMFQFNPDREKLVQALYEKGIFTLEV